MFTFEAKSAILSQSERDAYALLIAALPNGYQVIPHAPVECFVRQLHDCEHHHILSHNAAFLVVDSDWKPVLAIEWRSYPDAPANEAEYQQYVCQAYEESGLPFLLLQEEHLYHPEVMNDEVRSLLFAGPAKRVVRFKHDASPVPAGEPGFRFVAPRHYQRKTRTSAKCGRCVTLSWILIVLSFAAFLGLYLWKGYAGLHTGSWFLIPYTMSITATLLAIYPFRYRYDKRTLIVGAVEMLLLILCSSFNFFSLL